ncbi:hypothetical protein [Borrelia anserina]|uniref:Putative membrane associated protein n=1 Tax=Borrelia anserina BA2 TaxID=1313293 RepID=W5SM98_BORAN|nr:hypothetical protein [Borrelia anserina]AHH08289.1 Putative membrane associated protein [Borrelia anserina BA2]
MKKNKLLFSILAIFTLSLISCETPPEERTCGNYKISKTSQRKGI